MGNPGSPSRRDRAERSFWAVADATVWAPAILAATWLRHEFDTAQVLDRGVVALAVAAALLHPIAGWFTGPYSVGHRRGSFEESASLAVAVATTTAVLFAWCAVTAAPTPTRSDPLTAGVIALTGMLCTRFVARSSRARREPDRANRRVVVFGAGEAGRLLVAAMVGDPGSGYTPVAILDDDRSKARLRMNGVRVRGGRSDLGVVAARYAATAVIVAVPSAPPEVTKDLARRAAEAGLDVLTVPPLREVVERGLSTDDLRDLHLPDLLGRRAVALDRAPAGEQVRGRSVLVTGAGGSIGSELCRQISALRPRQLYLLDRDESGLHAAQLSLAGHGLLDTDDLVLADIRDPVAMHNAFAATRPDIVFHAAALKHLPLLESHPLEAWKTNVIGTLNVLRAAADADVETFVNISTDKAADPICALGYSKRIAERLTAGFARSEPGRYVSVRFGNVLGSRGSVVHAFRSQISQGGPVTVTHPDVQRFFMLIPEACQLVLEAAAAGGDGEVMVLDMGAEVRIVDVAEAMLRIARRGDVEITFTGLRPGEKLREHVFGTDEVARPTANPLVSSVAVPELAGSDLDEALVFDHRGAAAWMRRLATAGVTRNSATGASESAVGAVGPVGAVG